MSTEKIGEIKNWRFYFNSPNLVPRQYFFLYGILLPCECQIASYHNTVIAPQYQLETPYRF